MAASMSLPLLSKSKTARGLRRFSGEVILGAGDRIIVDDDSLTSLEAKVDARRARDDLQPDRC